jgi:hypothetical protein
MGDLTRAAGNSPARESDREFNRAYSAAADFLEANMRQPMTKEKGT